MVEVSEGREPELEDEEGSDVKLPDRAEVGGGVGGQQVSDEAERGNKRVEVIVRSEVS